MLGANSQRRQFALGAARRRGGLDTFFRKDEVSVKTGQLHFRSTQRLGQIDRKTMH